MKHFIYILFLSLFISCNNGEKNAGTGNEYTCPMHPEIVKQEPGQCPICGMDLVKKVKKETAKVYTCPMHPEIIRNKPGVCPICGMNLVGKQTEGESSQDTSIRYLLKPSSQFVVSKIKTVSLAQQQMPVQIKASGVIAYDTRYIHSISSRVSGRIEKLYVNYRFQPVKKGDKLLEIYSEELVTEQQNYIYLLTHDASNTEIISAAKTKLAQLGLTPNQIQNLNNSRKVQHSVIVYSPYSGHLHEGETFQNDITMSKTLTPSQQLIIREGMYVQKGQTLFNIYNTDKLWAVINIPAEVHTMIKKDQHLELYADGVKDPISGKFDFVEPSVRAGQNFVTARVYLNNPGNNLKIGTNVHANILLPKEKGNFLPSTAVINLGRSNVVFIMREKLFEAKKVITGLKTEGWVQVVSGLDADDMVAENAQLLIDSEAFIRPGKQ